MSQSQKPDILSRIIDGLAEAIDVFLRILIVVGFAAMAICVVWQVFSRYVLQTPSVYTGEISRFLFIWIALIGGAYTFGKGRHLAIEILAPALSGWRKQAARILVIAVIAAFAIWVMMIGGGTLVERTLNNGQLSPVMQLPMGYVYLCLPISGFFIVFYCLQMALRVFRGEDPVRAVGLEETGGPLD